MGYLSRPIKDGATQPQGILISIPLIAIGHLTQETNVFSNV